MSSRRDRPPSGMVNSGRQDSTRQFSARQPPIGASSARSNGGTFERPSSTNYDSYQLRSDRTPTGSWRGPECSTGRSDMSTNEVLRRMREKKNAPLIILEKQQLDKLGEYNAYSRPRPSQDIPLRSAFLDPKTNNFPQSHTRTELVQRIKKASAPHPSYDIDGDGWVSQEDFGLAKRFDLDGNGVIDPDESAIAKRILADEFFKKHAHDLPLFGTQLAGHTHKKNVEDLSTSESFQRAFSKLKSTERTLTAGTSKNVLSCMSLADNSLTKHNFFTNKFDCTAWNDFDAIPRATSQFKLDDHGGSRKRLLFSRKQQVTIGNQDKLDQSAAQKPAVYTRRSNLITNIEVENGR